MLRKLRRQRLVLAGALAVFLVLLLHRPPSLVAGLSEDAADEDDDSESITKDAAAVVVVPSYPYAIDPTDTNAKYFVFQTSGGWGNQRLILTWAMRAANAMDRILVMPMVAPHSNMWYGNDRLNASQMARADKVLDMDALNYGLVRGVRILDGHISSLRKLLPGKWKTYIRHSPPNWLPENAIRNAWRRRSERVVFWAKSSMWLCCAGGERMVPYVMFSKRLKLVARGLMKTRYNAIHVRRGGGHTRVDRRTARHYLDMHILPAKMNASLPLYVATDERNKSWFSAMSREGYSLVFWNDLVRDEQNNRVVSELMAEYPKDMRGDIIGFLEQLICAKAVKWTGSDGSTFSWAIDAMRRFLPLREIEWKQAAQSGQYAKIYSKDGEGAVGEPALMEKETESTQE